MMVFSPSSFQLSSICTSGRKLSSNIACARSSASPGGSQPAVTHLFHYERGKSIWSTDQGSGKTLLRNRTPHLRTHGDHQAARPLNRHPANGIAPSISPSFNDESAYPSSTGTGSEDPGLPLGRAKTQQKGLPIVRTGMVEGAGDILHNAALPGPFLVTAITGSDPFFQLGAAVALPMTLGIAFGITNKPDSDWYSQLKKPWWYPPGPVFGAAWGFLYPAMGVASWLVWRKGGFSKQTLPLTAYAVQLALNLLWPALFFGKKDIRLAFVDIVALLCMLFFTTLLFQGVDPLAGQIMAVYLAWVFFATILNYSLLELNGA